MSQPSAPGASLPTPPDFPVTWASPEDEQLFWFQDNMHFPVAVTPLNATVFQAAFAVGASRAISRLSMPISGLRTTVQNNYLYLGPVPVIAPQEELDARFQEMQRLTGELGPTAIKDWRETFEPQVLAHADAILSYDYAGASIPDAAAFVAGFYDRLVDAWDIHMRVNIPTMNAVFGFEEFIQGILGPEAVPESRKLLQGFDNKSVEMGRALWGLSRWVRSVDGLSAAVLEALVHDGKVELAGHPQAAAFQQKLAEFLDVYGWRSDVFAEFASKSWREDPSTPLTELKSFVRKEDSQDPFAAIGTQAAERDTVAAALEAKLPPDAHGPFRFLRQMSEQYLPIAEDHNFTIDQKFSTVCRHGFIEFGRKLKAEGTLSDPELVCYLTLDDLKAIAAGSDRRGLDAMARERRDDMRKWAAVTPPPALGTPPPADAPPDPLVSKFFGLGVVQGGNPKIINGYPSSDGVVTGEAKVLLSLDEADKLNTGDVMVVKMTMPAWTPLFGSVAAVISDSGGPLSHCAIVAREYGIPCVSGTQVGTSVIKDGMKVRVDGTTGVVQILG